MSHPRGDHETPPRLPTGLGGTPCHGASSHFLGPPGAIARTVSGPRLGRLTVYTSCLPRLVPGADILAAVDRGTLARATGNVKRVTCWSAASSLAVTPWGTR